MSNETITDNPVSAPNYTQGERGEIRFGSPIINAESDTKSWRCGSGACSKCNCKEYEGSTYTCANQGCGHAWQDHW